jgi:hypothetical protein
MCQCTRGSRAVKQWLCLCRCTGGGCDNSNAAQAGGSAPCPLQAQLGLKALPGGYIHRESRCHHVAQNLGEENKSRRS